MKLKKEKRGKGQRRVEEMGVKRGKIRGMNAKGKGWKDREIKREREILERSLLMSESVEWGSSSAHRSVPLLLLLDLSAPVHLLPPFFNNFRSITCLKKHLFFFKGVYFGLHRRVQLVPLLLQTCATRTPPETRFYPVFGSRLYTN